jgi:hypothetical protein
MEEYTMFRIIDWVERFFVRIYYGPEEDSDPGMIQTTARAYKHQPLDFFDSRLQDFAKRERLNRELENAEWILDFEKRRARLQKKTAAQRSEAEHLGLNTDRLRKLEHHLAGLRRSLD